MKRVSWADRQPPLGGGGGGGGGRRPKKSVDKDAAIKWQLNRLRRQRRLRPRKPPKLSAKKKKEQARLWDALLLKQEMKKAREVRRYARHMLKEHHQGYIQLEDHKHQMYLNLANSEASFIPLAYDKKGRGVLPTPKNALVDSWRRYKLEPLTEDLSGDLSPADERFRQVNARLGRKHTRKHTRKSTRSKSTRSKSTRSKSTRSKRTS